MSTITIRDVDPGLERQLRAYANKQRQSLREFCLESLQLAMVVIDAGPVVVNLPPRKGPACENTTTCDIRRIR